MEFILIHIEVFVLLFLVQLLDSHFKSTNDRMITKRGNQQTMSTAKLRNPFTICLLINGRSN